MIWPNSHNASSHGHERDGESAIDTELSNYRAIALATRSAAAPLREERTGLIVNFSRSKMDRILSRTSSRHPAGAESSGIENGENVQSRGARSFPAVASRVRGYPRQSQYEEFSPWRALGDDTSAPVSPCCHSRAQIFRLVRRISIYPIYDTCLSSDVETTGVDSPS